MAELYAVEVPKAPDHENRFLTFLGNEYSGPQSLVFVPLSKASRKGLSWCRQMVDDAQKHASSGGSPYLATARVITFVEATKQWVVVYEGKDKVEVVTEPAVPKCMKCQDGTWRALPPDSHFQKGSRMWALSIAFVDSANIPRADRINGKTKLETATNLFESSLPYLQEYVRTLPFADPKDVPAPVAPKVEYVPTRAELDAVAPLDLREWNLMPSAEHVRRYAFDPLYRAAFKKMLALDEQRKRQEAERTATLTEDEELAKIRKKFLKDDENERLKSGIGKIV